MRVIRGVLIAVVGIMLTLVLLPLGYIIVALGYFTVESWIQEREQVRSKERIPKSDVEIYGVKLERYASTEVSLSGFVRNRSAKYLLKDVHVQVMFQGLRHVGATAYAQRHPTVAPKQRH